MVGLCRLCASVRKIDMLEPMTREVCLKLKECFTMEMCHVGDKLPKHICRICLEALQNAFAFFKKVQDSQESLKLLFDDNKTNPTDHIDNAGQTYSVCQNKEIENSKTNEKQPELDRELVIDETHTDDKVLKVNLETNNQEEVFRLYQIIETDESSAEESSSSEKDFQLSTSMKHFSEDIQKAEIESYLLEPEVGDKDEDIVGELEGNDEMMTEEGPTATASFVSGIISNDTVIEIIPTKSGIFMKESHQSLELDKEKDFVDSCDTCDKSFNDQNATMKKAENNETKCYKCPHCDKKFTRLGNCRVHEKIHSGLKEFTCDICDRQFHQKHNLEVHMYTHINDKIYKCKICKKSLKTPNSLEKHMLIHNDIKKFSCDYCGKKFRTKDSKRSHERVHTGEKPFKCKYCDHSFRFRSGLMGHVNLHTGERPYSCTHCTRQFTNWGNMNKHIKRCHSRQEDIK